MLEISDKEKYITLFDNITELTNYISRPRKAGRDNSSESASEIFSGTKSYEEAFDSLKYGDENLFNKIKKEIDKIKIDKFLGNVANRQKYENRFYGCVPNVPAYLIKNPVNMINPEKNVISHKIVNIFLNIGVSSCNDAKDIIRNGTIYLSVIDLLEKAGYRCNLYAGVSTEDDEYFFMYVRVKTDREPLNIKKIAFPIASPSMLRRIYFKWAEVFDYDKNITGWGYGRPADSSDSKKYLKQSIKEDFIFWDYHEGSSSKSVEKIIEELKNQGINIQ